MSNLNFYTTGEAYTKLVRDFWQESSVKSAWELLDPLDVKTKEKILTGYLKFEGDSRDGDLDIIEDNSSDMLLYSFQHQQQRQADIIIEIYREIGTSLNSKRANIEKLNRKLFNILSGMEILKPYVVTPDLNKLAEFKLMNNSLEKREEPIERAAIRSLAQKYIYGDDEIETAFIKMNNKFSSKLLLEEKIIGPDSFSKVEDGYIARNGDFWQCDFQEHSNLSKTVFEHYFPELTTIEDYQKYLESKGFVKISSKRVWFWPSNMRLNLSNQQIRTLIKFYKAHNITTIPFNVKSLPIKMFEEGTINDYLTEKAF